MRKVLQKWALMAAMLMPLMTYAQSLSTYTVTTDNVAYQSIAATGTPVDFFSYDDDCETFALPFAMPFGDVMLEQGSTIGINTNGYISLGIAATAFAPDGTQYAASLINPLLNSDGHMNRVSGAAVYRKYVYEDGLSKQIIEFHGLSTYDEPYDYIDMQVVLVSDGSIQFIYDSCAHNCSSNWRVFLREHTNNDYVYLGGSWAQPVTTTSMNAMSGVPARGQRITFSRPVFSCANRPASLSASNVEATSATLSWPSDDAIGNWVVSLIAGDAAATYPTTTNSLDLVGLTPSTDYTASVRAICANGDTSLARTISFRTPCVAIPASALPYAEDNEGYASNGLNPCWYRDNNYSTSTAYPYVVTYEGHSGSKSLYFYLMDFSMSGAKYEYVALPAMEAAIDSLELSFWVYADDNSAARWAVGVMDDPTDRATFDTLAIFEQPITDQWIEYNVPLNGYTGNGRYIAFMGKEGIHTAYSPNGNYTMSFYLDDISVSRLSACSRPQNVRTRSVTASSAEVVWDADEYPTQHIVYWGTANNMNEAIDSIYFTGNSYTIDFLEGNTTYYVWVVKNCGEERSNAVATSFTTANPCSDVLNLAASNVTFTTALLSWEPAPYSEASEYIVTVNGSDTNIALSTTSTYVFVSGLTEGVSHTVRVSTICNDDTTAGTTITFSTPTPGTIANGTAQASGLPANLYYEYSVSQQIYPSSMLAGVGDTIFGIVFSQQSNRTSNRTIRVLLGNTTMNSYGSTNDAIPSSSLTEVFSGSQTFKRYWDTITFTQPFVRDASQNLVVMMFDNSGNYVNGSVYFYAQDQSATQALYSYRDGATYEGAETFNNTADQLNTIRLIASEANSDCVAPTVAVAATTDNSIDIEWFSTNDPLSYAVLYKEAAASEWIVADSAVTNNDYTIAGLAPGTLYSIRVVADCGSSTAAASIQAYTDCGASLLPYIDNFSAGMNHCWTNYSTVGSYNNPTIENDNGNGTLYMPQYAMSIMQDFEAPINSLQLRFDLKTSNTSDYVLVGVCDQADDYQGFEIFDTVRALSADTWFSATVSFADRYPANGRMALKADHGNVYIDNINVDYIPMCPTVQGVTVSNVTTDGAQISWPAMDGLASSYIVEFCVEGVEQGNGVAYATNQTTFNASGLQEGSTYMVYVYTVCAATGDTALASSAAVFGTSCTTIGSYPYVMNFESATLPHTETTGVLPHCWNYDYLCTDPWMLNAYYYPQIAYYPLAATQGDFSLALNGLTVVAMPANSVATSELMLTFHDYAPYAGDVALVVGTVDSVTPGFAESFVAVDTIINTAQHGEYTVYFGGHQGLGQYIAFKNISLEGYYQSMHYIDSVVIDMAPACLPVVDLSVAGTTDSSVTLSWTNNSYAPQFEIAYSTTPAQPTSGTVVSGTSATINGLTQNTTYYFFIRALCSATSHSEWSSPVSATPGVWIMRPNRTDTVAMCGGTIYDDGGANGNYSSNQSSYLVVMPSDPQSLVSLNVNFQGENGYDELYIYDGIGNGGQMLFHGSSASNLVVEANLNALTLWFSSDGIDNYSGFAIDVTCVNNSCPRAQNLAMVSNGATSATIQWTDNTASATWEVEYGPIGFTPGMGTVATTSSIPYTITGLATASVYDCYVRPICSVGDTGTRVFCRIASAACDNPDTVNIWPATATLASDEYCSLNNVWKYSYSQSIHHASELQGLGNIAGFAFEMISDLSAGVTGECDVYIGHTSKNSFTSASDFISIDSLTLVFTGDLTYATGWNYFNFDIPFTYNGTSNLVVAINRRSGSWIDPNDRQSVISTSARRNIITYQDDAEINLAAPGNWQDEGMNEVPAFKFLNCAVNTCILPVLGGVTTDYSVATINWTADNDSCQLIYKSSNDAVWSDPIVATAGTYTLSGLVPATTYMYRVRQICDAQAEIFSNWADGSFTTDSLPCYAPENLEASSIQGQQATLDWATGTNQTSWSLHVFNTTMDQTFEVTAHPYTVTGLIAGVTYYAAVRSDCQGVVESNWSDTISFTTVVCDPVSDVTVSNVGPNSAHVSWTPGANNTGSWEVIWNYQGAGVANPLGSQVVNTPAFDITGLSGAIQYEVSVRAVCGTNYYSNYSAASFATTVGILDADGQLAVNIYPNPATSTTTITLGGVNGTISLSIIDMSGRTVRTDAMECSGDCQKTLLVDGLAAGTYFVRIYGDNVNTVKKLVVK